jgi:hypothetical protein
MKKSRVRERTRTTIGNITEHGAGFSDQQLRLVTGGQVSFPTMRTTYPASMKMPGQTDTFTDTESDTTTWW